MLFFLNIKGCKKWVRRQNKLLKNQNSTENTIKKTPERKISPNLFSVFLKTKLNEIQKRKTLKKKKRISKIEEISQKLRHLSSFFKNIFYHLRFCYFFIPKV